MAAQDPPDQRDLAVRCHAFLHPGLGPLLAGVGAGRLLPTILAWELVEDLQTPSLAHAIQLALEAAGLVQAPQCRSRRS